jgi:hypothetical protein
MHLKLGAVTVFNTATIQDIRAEQTNKYTLAIPTKKMHI